MLIIVITSFLTGLVLAPLGSVVLWKRYVYFSDGLAHASMLISVISTLTQIPPLLSAALMTLIFPSIVLKVRNKTGNSAAIGFTSSMMIAVALLLSSLYPEYINLTELLFGDILAATCEDIITLTSLLLGVILFFYLTYHDLIILILSRDIASSRGIRVSLLELIFLILLSLAIFLTIKIVGTLLVTSIILIPAMTARVIASSPVKMIILSLLFTLIMNFVGIGLSFYTDLPFAPLLILTGGLLYGIVFVGQRLFRVS